MDTAVARLHKLATGCLALAILAIGVALWANQAGRHLTGPQAICALPNGHTWLAVDDELWHIGPDEDLVSRKTIADLGLPALPGNLVNAPDGRIAITVRGQERVYWLDPDAERLAGQVDWQWPQAHRDLLSHPHTLAVGPQGQFAVATGGGHRVLAFNAEGHFLGITRPDTYRFTNGLWWGDEGIWTTDTNRFALVRLDPLVLGEQQRIELHDSSDPARYLSWMRAYPKLGLGDTSRPLATVVRMRNGMRTGRVVHVMADGSEKAVALGEDLQPQDLAWRQNELLVVDSQRYRIRRSDLDGRVLPDFGAGQVQTLLGQSLLKAQRLSHIYRIGLLAGALLLAAGLLVLGYKRQRQAVQHSAQLAPEFRLLGTPVLSKRQLIKDGLALHWPWLLLLVWMLLPRGLDLIAQQSGHAMPLPGLWRVACLLMGLLTVSWVMIRRMRRAATDPGLEGLLNVRATSLLTADGVWAAYREPGERLRETFMLGPVGAVRWLVLTDRRLLSFRVTIRDKVLTGSWHRSDIESVSLPALRSLHWWQRWLRQPVEGNWLKIRTRDGQVLQGVVPSAITAGRVAAILGLACGKPVKQRLHAHTDTHTAGSQPTTHSSWLQTVASALVPGSGQWWQGRPESALIMFIIFAAWLGVGTGPVTLVWFTGSAEVAPRSLIAAWTMQALWGLFSAWDAWYLSGARRR